MQNKPTFQLKLYFLQNKKKREKKWEKKGGYDIYKLINYKPIMPKYQLKYENEGFIFELEEWENITYYLLNFWKIQH